MSDKKKNDLCIRIDVRYNRISFHQSTLREIGDPAFIHLGVQPTTMNLIVLGTWVDERKAIRVRYSKAGTFSINSKPLIDGIHAVSQCLDRPGSYLLKGKKVRSIPAISFSLNEAYIESEDLDCGGIIHEDPVRNRTGI